MIKEQLKEKDINLYQEVEQVIRSNRKFKQKSSLFEAMTSNSYTITTTYMHKEKMIDELNSYYNQLLIMFDDDNKAIEILKEMISDDLQEWKDAVYLQKKKNDWYPNFIICLFCAGIFGFLCYELTQISWLSIIVGLIGVGIGGSFSDYLYDKFHSKY